MKKVKFTFPYTNFPIVNQTPGKSSVWGDYEFYINQDIKECDYWIIFGYLPEEDTTICPPENTFFFTGEPPSVQTFNNDFLKQFATIITCQRQIDHPNKQYFLQGLPWHIGKTYDELVAAKKVKKTKELSIVVSSKQFTEGHKKRYDFVMKLKEHFGDRLDVFGRGINEVKTKWDAIADYKYSIAIENSVYEDYVSEKIYDCYLASAFPIYYGAPNLDKYFSKDSFVNIDINDFDKSVKIIGDLLNDKDHYKNHLAAIEDAKDKCLNEYNIFAFVANYIKQHDLDKNTQKKAIKLTTEYFFDHKPKVSVLMPAYNAEKYIGDAIESILNQTFENYEFIIINDGSTDKTREIIKTYNDPRIRLIDNKTNLKLIATLNKGIDLATGEYILRMDADDSSYKNRIAKQVEYMDSHPQIGISGTSFKVMGTNDYISHPTKPAWNKIKLMANTCLAHPTVIMRTKVIKDNDLYYNPEFLHSEDYELWVRAARVTQIGNLKDTLLEYRLHENQITQTYKVENSEGSNKARLMQLEELLPDRSKEEEELYLKLIQFIPPNESLFKVNSLLVKLRNANNQKGIYKKLLFKQHLATIWIHTIKDLKKYSWQVLAAIAISPFTKYVSLDHLEDYAKFIVKCIINYKR